MGQKKYNVIIKNKTLRGIKKLPQNIQERFNVLLHDLIDKGPIQPNWSNFSKLAKNKYHCHLGYSWVACWEQKEQKLIIEVYYVGSREKVPYKKSF
jgi:mRNA-degrading endonuclease RelE of RelBE toxin-antitoxin system